MELPILQHACFSTGNNSYGTDIVCCIIKKRRPKSNKNTKNKEVEVDVEVATRSPKTTLTADIVLAQTFVCLLDD